MRFVLVSTHTDQTTGYSKVSYNLLRQLATLAPKVKTYHFGFQRHPARSNLRKIPDGVIAYDAAANEDPKEEGFGFNKIHEYLEMVGPDVVMIYNDPLVVYKFIESMKHEKGKMPYKLWVYVDQVYHGIAQPLIDKINEHADRIYAFTPYWRDVYLKYGSHPDVRVLEHAVDPAMFSTLPKDARLAIRAKMNIPQDAIVFLNANRNSQRKRLDLTIMGFVRLLILDPKTPYYMLIATNLNPQSGAYYDVQRIYLEELRNSGLAPEDFVQRLMLIDTAPPNVVSDETINQLYNITDIGINTSDGEGFGLCQLEHLYTGAPQVVTNVGSYDSFLNRDVADLIGSNGRVYQAGGMPLGFWSPTFDPDVVADKMRTVAETIPERKKAIAAYDFKSWASVCDAWLEDILTLS
jgi:hypothetical protein